MVSDVLTKLSDCEGPNQVLKAGAKLFNIPGHRQADFGAAILKALERTKSHVYAVPEMHASIDNRKRALSDLRDIRESLHDVLNVAIRTSQEARDALDNALSTNDERIPDLFNTLSHMIRATGLAEQAVRVPARRGRKKRPPIGDPDTSPLDGLIADLYFAVRQYGGKWCADKNNRENPAVTFLRLLGTAGLLPEILKGLSDGRVCNISREVAAYNN